MRLLRSRRDRPRVLDAVDGQVRFEVGSRERFGSPDRAAVVVHWSESAWLTRSFVELVGQLSRHGYRVVVVSASSDPHELEWRGRRPSDVTVIRKPNIGYDFGSWTVGLAELPSLAAAERVLLVNDSMVGPFVDLGDVLERFEDSRADVFGLTDTRQYFLHLQSYFLGFGNGVLADPPLRHFFADVRHEKDKWDIIWRYELGLSRLFRREAYGVAAAFHADDVVAAGDNPVIRGWWRLLERGFPFVKREILRRPDVAPHGDRVGRQVAAMFGQDIGDWV